MFLPSTPKLVAAWAQACDVKRSKNIAFLEKRIIVAFSTVSQRIKGTLANVSNKVSLLTDKNTAHEGCLASLESELVVRVGEQTYAFGLSYRRRA